MYQSRWQIELFFKHIKQHLTIKTYYSQFEQGGRESSDSCGDCLLIDITDETGIKVDINPLHYSATNQSVTVRTV